MARFGSVLTAMVTPFDKNNDLDLEGAQKLAKHLVENGNDGLVIAGTTGESPTISYSEQEQLVVAVRAAVPETHLVAGVGSNDTRAALELCSRIEAAGADGILAVTPYYNRPSQQGLLEHFSAIAAATEKPIMLYDIPARTGRKISSAVIAKLAKIDNVVALKDAAGDPAETSHLIKAVGENLEVYSGDDSLTLPLAAVGAVGVVGVATHWLASPMSLMLQAVSRGDLPEAQRLNQIMLPSFRFESSDEAPNPIPTKALLKVLGMPGGSCRLPMGPEPERLADQARQLLADLEGKI